MDLLSKGDFARHIGVTPGRVSQMISSGMIGQDALAGEGRSARVVVAKAVEQIRRRRDTGQGLGNGLKTKLWSDPVTISEADDTLLSIGKAASAAPDLSESADALTEEERARALLSVAVRKGDDVAERIQHQKLEEIQRRNRLAAIEELRQTGQLVHVDDMRREVGKIAQDLVSLFVGMAPDIANAFAAKFGLSQRDALFLVRQVMAERRAEAAKSRREVAEALPDTVERELEL